FAAGLAGSKLPRYATTRSVTPHAPATPTWTQVGVLPSFFRSYRSNLRAPVVANIPGNRFGAEQSAAPPSRVIRPVWIPLIAPAPMGPPLIEIEDPQV